MAVRFMYLSIINVQTWQFIGYYEACNFRFEFRM
jgi:hypothetical protein